MSYLESYLNNLRQSGHNEIADSVQKTAGEFDAGYLAPFSWAEQKNGLLFGNVQAGKTGQMFGILCAAADRGFRLFILMTTDNVALQQQTQKRVGKDLGNCGFCICGETDTQKFIDNDLVKPAIIILKKNFSVLLQWNNTLQSSGFVTGNGLFILDDEADAASLNALVNRGRITTINRRITSIRDTSVGSFYLQVTGTPQAILLQTAASGYKPSFVSFFEPGRKYLGGDFFFTDRGKNAIRFIGTPASSGSDDLNNALLHHMTVSAQLLLSGRDVCSFMIHPGSTHNTHVRAEKQIKDAIAGCVKAAADGSLRAVIKKEYDLMRPEYSVKKPFDAVYDKVCSMLAGNEFNVMVMNGVSHIAEDQYQTGSNIIIGGNVLGRGVTFPKLQTVYYTRTAKQPQADTMWQHSRMFGYDRDPGLMAVFITQHLYKLFTDINDANNSMIHQMAKGYDKIQIIYPEGLNPTRKTVIDKSAVGIIAGGTNYYPDDPDNDSVEDINKILNAFDGREYSCVLLNLMITLLGHIIPSDDFKNSGFIGALKALTVENPGAQGILIVRKNRAVTQGTGSLLSPNDRELGDKFPDKVVLTMYQAIGPGWKKPDLWVPNIKLPEYINYYDA